MFGKMVSAPLFGSSPNIRIPLISTEFQPIVRPSYSLQIDYHGPQIYNLTKTRLWSSPSVLKTTRNLKNISKLIWFNFTMKSEQV